MTKRNQSYGPKTDARFTLHHRQPRADKLDVRQRKLCHADAAFAEALGRRVANPARFSAFMAGAASYVALEALCPKCGHFRRRTRDRGCYSCHLRRGGENFARIRAKLAPLVSRTKDSHLDLLQRQKADREHEFTARQFGDLSAKVWPMGRLEVTFPDGYIESDFSALSWRACRNAVEQYPVMMEVFRWAGWPVD